MLIAINKADAKAYKLPILSNTKQEYEQYWCFISIHKTPYVLKLQSLTYFCLSISKYNEEENNKSYSSGFGIIQSASLRARIQTIRRKATSLIGGHTNDPQEIKNTINGIPWQFLGFKSPEELAVKLKQGKG